MTERTFDPNGAASHDGLFGLPFSIEEARFVVVPVPFDATTSLRDGTRHGPAAVLQASYQVDLFDVDFGRPWEAGIAMLPLRSALPKQIARLNANARLLAEPIIDAGGDVEGKPRLQRALVRVNGLSARMCESVERTCGDLLARGKVPIVLGGDHSTPFGAIKAYGARFPGLGILHIDAHADLRPAYEGFEHSHASIMHNVCTRIGPAGGIASLVQVGIRDVGENEVDEIRRAKRPDETRITTFFDADLHARLADGQPWTSLCRSIVEALPEQVYISFDIDGLDPQLCPDTGTPVPGGLDFNEMLQLLRVLVQSGRRIVGFDLNEVAPGRPLRRSALGGDWNANVGARVLYKLIGAALACGRSQ